MRPRSGYTLIELMAVIIIMGLVASAVTLGVGPSLRRARAQDAVEQFRSADEAARQTARRFARSCQLRLDLDASAIQRLEGDHVVFKTELPAGVRIVELRTPTRRISQGQIDLPYSIHGISETYSIKLETSDGVRRLLFSGLTGEATAITDEAKSDAIFAALAPRNGSRTRQAIGDDAD